MNKTLLQNQYYFDFYPQALVAIFYPSLLLFVIICFIIKRILRSGILSDARKKKNFTSVSYPQKNLNLYKHIESLINKIPFMKPDLRLLADVPQPPDLTKASSNYLRMKIYDLAAEFTQKFTQRKTYPYPKLPEFLNQQTSMCSCLKSQSLIQSTTLVLELYNNAILGPNEFKYEQVKEFETNLQILNDSINNCTYNCVKFNYK